MNSNTMKFKKALPFSLEFHTSFYLHLEIILIRNSLFSGYQIISVLKCL